MNRTSRSRPQLTGVSLWARFPICAEALERRVLLSAFTVTNTNDSGPGSLRQAILDADAAAARSSAGNQITFSIPGTGIPTIAPSSPLPALTGAVVVGIVAHTVPQQRLVAEISGVHAGPFANGLVLDAGANSASIGGLIIARFAKDGIVVEGANDTVAGNLIGTDPSGSESSGNGGNGITVSGGQPRINGNVISGNGGSGILITGSGGGELSGNFIGTDPSGQMPVGNGGNPVDAYRDGISDLAPGVTIGGIGLALFTPGNTVSANKGNGILVGGADGSGTLIEGNTIGTDITGSLPLGNGGNGIVLAAGKVTVGVTPIRREGSAPSVIAGGGNVVAANRLDGILILSSNSTLRNNYVGLNVVGAPIGNAGNGIEIRGGNDNTIGIPSNVTFLPLVTNVISANGGAGITIRTDSSGAGGSANVVSDDYVGTDPTGNIARGNGGNGVEVFASNNIIGGPSKGPVGLVFDVNVIAANRGSGVYLGDSDGVPQSGNQVSSNEIGPLSSRGVPNGNGLGNGADGITIYRSSNNTISENTITASARNGASVIASGPAVTDATGNLITQNAFFNLGGIPIDLGNDGPTPNHSGVSAGGPNELQNHPTILSATSTNRGPAIVRYTLDSAPGTYIVELYLDAYPGFDDNPRIVLQTITLPSGPSPTYSALLSGVAQGATVMAAATDAKNDTGEFSPPTTVSLVSAVAQPPHVIGMPTLGYFVIPNTLSYKFDENVFGVAPAALQLRNLDTGATLAPTSVSYDRNSFAATFALPNPLPGGNYMATLLSSAVTGIGGIHLDGDAPPPDTGPNDFTYQFYLPPGDVNRDGVVDFQDLTILARHFGQAGTWAQGDLNGDGKVDFADLVLLARSYGRTMVL